MTDITANVVVSNPRPVFTDSRTFRAVANGRIYIGQIDTDPVNPVNQIPVYVANENGNYVQISQPLVINSAGKIVYNGQLVNIVTVQGHSMAIYDSYGTQIDYIPNVLNYDPDQFSLSLSGADGFSYIGAANYSDIRNHSGNADKFLCYGKENIFDGGYGVFLLDKGDKTSLDDGGTILVSASGGRYKRLSDGVAMLEWWEGANIDDTNSDCLSAWNKFANSDVYSKLKLKTGTYRFSGSLSTVAGKQKDIEGQGFWKTILQIAGTGYGLKAFETLTARRFQIRRVNNYGIVTEPGLGDGVGSGFIAANNINASAYNRLEDILVFGHFSTGFEINAVSGTYVNCNAYNVKGDGWNIDGGSNHFEKCWAENVNGRAYYIQGIGNQLTFCYEENSCLTQPSVSQVVIGRGDSGSGNLTRITDFNFNPRNSALDVPVFDVNAASVNISAIEEIPVSDGKLVARFSQYSLDGSYDGPGGISGGSSSGYPVIYNPRRSTIVGTTTPGGGIAKKDDVFIHSSQLVTFSALDQVVSGIPGGMIVSNNNASERETTTSWNSLYPGSNINLYSWRITTVTNGAKVSLKYFNQGFESQPIVTTDGVKKIWSGSGSNGAPFVSGSTSTDSLLGLKLVNNQDSIAQASVLIELIYSFS